MTADHRCGRTTPHSPHRSQMGGFGIVDCPGNLPDVPPTPTTDAEFEALPRIDLADAAHAETVRAAVEELDKTSTALAGLKDSIREAIALWVETGRIPEADGQSVLRQLSIPELVRNRYTVRLPITGTLNIDVIGEDEDDALTKAIDIANRMCQVLVADVNVQSLRVNRAAPVQITRH